MRLVAYVPDLMDRSRFTRVDMEKVFVPELSRLTAEVRTGDVVVVDLNRQGSLEAVARVEVDARRLGFTNHDNHEMIEAAKVAGVDVFARSRFFSHLVEILAEDSH